MSGKDAARLTALVVMVTAVAVAGCSTSYFDPNMGSRMTVVPMPDAVVSNASHSDAILELRLAREAGAVPSEDNFVWMGRRLSYLGEFQAAIDEYTLGLEHYPDSYRLLRHRGHRWITLRQFDRAVEDLSRAAVLIDGVPDEIEPDGAPNPVGIPRSTSHTNIYYHLGLAHYLRGEFESALRAYEECMSFVNNDDMHVATAYWMYLTQKRLGRDEEARRTVARIRPRMEVLENTTYHDLLLLYRAWEDVVTGRRSTFPPSMAARAERVLEETPRDATTGYGAGAFFLLGGGKETAAMIFREILRSGNPAAFGYIAAEVELTRMSDEVESQPR